MIASSPGPWQQLIEAPESGVSISLFKHLYLIIGLCLARVYRVMDACGKFGEHERSVTVARGIAESNSSFFSQCAVPKNKRSRELFTNTPQWYGLNENGLSEIVNENLLL